MTHGLHGLVLEDASAPCLVHNHKAEEGRGRGRARRRESQEKEEGGNFSREKRGRNYVEQVTAAAVLALLSSSSVVRVRPAEAATVLHYL